MELLPLYLVMLAVPFGVAGQHVLAGLAFLAALYRLRRGFSAKRTHALQVRYAFPVVSAVAYVGWLIVATYLNPANSADKALTFPFGYLDWILFPPLFYLIYGKLTTAQWQRLGRFGAWIVAVWGVIAVSQHLWGWRIVGATFGPDGARPRGFYSHPLTFAYAVLMVWPLAVQTVIRRPRLLESWLLFLGSGTVLVLTESRTVQAVALLIVAVNILTLLSGRKRLAVILVALGLLVGTATTDNMVSRKFKRTFSEEGLDRTSDYPDDRVAFWHAHWLMVKERPVLGHGIDLDTKYRLPYYDQLGLSDMPKKYEAHNLYLQILACGGVVGLGIFLLWLAWYVVYTASSIHFPYARQVILQTIAAFCLAGLTQNSFQDAEVRFCLMLTTVLIWLCGYQPLKETSENASS